MSFFIGIIKTEYKHFARGYFKIVSCLLFFVAALYGLQNGYDLFRKHNSEIITIKSKNAQTIQKLCAWFDEGKKGNEDRPWVDITTPFWAIWNAPSSAIKEPSALMPFSIGQAEQFGYYKQVTNWSTTFDSDLAEELANPENLTTGTLDFSFVVLYLLPILIIILLFNIGGLENDLGIDRLVAATYFSQKKWLFARFAFYFITLIIIMLVLMLPYAIFTKAIQNELLTCILLFLYIVFYILFWFVIFFFINSSGKGSANHAIKMISAWILLCIIMPGTIHQVASLKFPASYMTDYIDAGRNEANKFWELPTETIRNKLLELHPELAQTKHGKDTVLDETILANSSSALVNHLMKNTAMMIEIRNDTKNEFIRNTYWINPVSFFQNNINMLADNDYYAYKQFRNRIQVMVDRKVSAILLDSWNKVAVDKERYNMYVENFNN